MFMNRLKNFIVALTFFALLGLGACKPEPEKQKYLGNYPLGEVKDYLYFKPGSYWVYECDSTLELDSQVMISIDTPWFHKSYIDYQLLFFNKKSITFIITDEGSGFDYNNLADPTAPENIEDFGGRGVFLMKQLADVTIFQKQGSIVELTFKL